MKNYLLAIALTVGLPAMATAQTLTAAAKAACCCEKMKDMACGKDGKMDCCKGMARMDHGPHDMKASADPHAGHAMPTPLATSPSAAATPTD